jgi:hypothetical protein
MVEHDIESQIRARAYDLWETEGRPCGRERIHWLRAEAEVRERLQPRSPVSQAKLYRVIANDKIPPVFVRRSIRQVTLRFPVRAKG